MTHKVEIDIETAERITLVSLKYHELIIKKELDDFKNGEYLHNDDVVYNTRLLEALDVVIKYFGG